MNKITLPLGIATGLAISAAMLYQLSALDVITPEQGSAGYLERILASAGGVIAMIVTARKHPDIGFGKLIKIGLATCGITALVILLCSIIYFKWINPTYIGDYLNVLTEQRLAHITDEAQRAETIASTEKNRAIYTNPFIYSFIITISTFLISLMPIAISGYLTFRINRAVKKR